MRTPARLPLDLLSIIAVLLLAMACSQAPSPETLTSSSTAAAEPAVCSTIPGDNGCPSSYTPPELCQPREIAASNGVLETEIDVAKKSQCVPVFDSETETWSMEAKTLRNYGVPNSAGEIIYGFPAPTFRMKRKPGETSPENGDVFKMLLTNSMGPTTVPKQMECFPGNGNRFAGDTHPNCFHGNETTNFHFHGFHISPQPLQDYVLLQLYPEKTPGIPNYRPGMTNDELRELERIGGSYRYDLDPLPYNQPEGTHWYHAHHHGATAMQVINGMAGTFIIEGPFDEWLNNQFGYEYGEPKLKERLFVVQQVNDALASSTPLVNGQGDPVVSIAPGEIQRWRFVSATTQASAQLSVDFAGLEVCQIQMDGVQFSPGNYRDQPLLTGDGDEGCKTNADFTLSPGNRADFLVKNNASFTAALKAAISGEVELMTRVVGSVDEEGQLEAGIRKFIDQGPVPLLSIRLRGAQQEEMNFPTTWPPLPEFLTPPTPQDEKTVRYQMERSATSNPAPIFKIDDMQVRDCVPPKMSLMLGHDESWTVLNLWNGEPALVPDADDTNRGIAHPFHIHTNPFYVVRNGNTTYPHGIWQDTIALPLASDSDSDKEMAASVELHMEFEDYTGGFVQHCHILGHEDRGMMTLVQTLCPGTDKFGTPVANQPDDCSSAGQHDALEVCDP